MRSGPASGLCPHFTPNMIGLVLYTVRKHTPNRMRRKSSRKWVLKCKQFRSECVYAEIPSEGTATYFFPKKPELPNSLTFTCPNCGHKDA